MRVFWRLSVFLHVQFDLVWSGEDVGSVSIAILFGFERSTDRLKPSESGIIKQAEIQIFEVRSFFTSGV